MATEGKKVYAVQLGEEERDLLRDMLSEYGTGLARERPKTTNEVPDWTADLETARGALMALNTGASGWVDAGQELVTVPLSQADCELVRNFLHNTRGVPVARLTPGFMLGVAWGGVIFQARTRKTAPTAATKKEES